LDLLICFAKHNHLVLTSSDLNLCFFIWCILSFDSLIHKHELML